MKTNKVSLKMNLMTLIEKKVIKLVIVKIKSNIRGNMSIKINPLKFFSLSLSKTIINSLSKKKHNQVLQNKNKMIHHQMVKVSNLNQHLILMRSRNLLKITNQNLE